MKPLKSYQTDQCRDCLLLQKCGGDPNPDLFGRGCHSGGFFDDVTYPDEMHPGNPDRFALLEREVGDLNEWKFRAFTSPDTSVLPNYVTKIDNGSSRISFLDPEWIAIPLFKILKNRKKGGYAPRFSSETDLRNHFKISPSSKIIALGVDIDKKLERFWHHRLQRGVLEPLSKLGISAVTAPNFSLFTDSPRPQHLLNQKRMLISCSDMSAYGIPVIPHLNAITERDWSNWASFLKEHQEIRFVTKEFQTGLKYDGVSAIDALATIRDQIGRDLHPILVGGGVYYPYAQEIFGDNFTVIDSRPSKLAISRLVLRYSATSEPIEVQVKTIKGQGIDHLFHENLMNYPRMLAEGKPRKSAEKNDVCQIPLKLDSSTPNLTPQPLERGISPKYFGTISTSHSSKGLQSSSR